MNKVGKTIHQNEKAVDNSVTNMWISREEKMKSIQTPSSPGLYAQNYPQVLDINNSNLGFFMHVIPNPLKTNNNS